MLTAILRNAILVLTLWLPLSSWASELKSDERAVFFPAFAWTGQDTWNLQVHGWVFEPGEHKFYGALLRRALGIKPKELTAEEHAIYSQRAQYFLHDNERRKVLTISLDGKPYAVGPSSPNGHFTAQLPVPSEWIQKVRTSRLTNDFTGFELVAHGKTGPAPFGTIQVFSDTGLSVISDIDDTIKISQVLERKELLKNTFCPPVQAGARHGGGLPILARLRRRRLSLHFRHALAVVHPHRRIHAQQ